MKERRNAFTLAEVLITLVIIGVIGALTVPALIQNTQKQELTAALKKTYSTLSQVTQQIIAEEGNLEEWSPSLDDIYNAYKEKLNVLKDCGTSAGCWPQSPYTKFLNGNKASSNRDIDGDSNWRKLVLSDGVSIAIDFGIPPCSSVWDNGGLKNSCGRVYADINGAKGPNQLGRDIFFFGIKKDGLYPAGVDGAADRSCSTSNAAGGIYGEGCAARVLTEGAMKY